MCITKWSAIALFLPVALFIGYHLFNKYGRQLPSKVMVAPAKLSRLQLGLLLAGVVVAGLLFIERPVINSIRYGSPDVVCDEVISQERCLSSPTYAAYDELAANKPAIFEPQDPAKYFFSYWLPTMTIKASNLLERGDKSVLLVVKLMYYVLTYASIVLLLICLRSLVKNRYNRLFLAILVLSTAILFAGEYMSYLTYGQPVAIRARYLVPVLPLLFYLVFAAVPAGIKKHKVPLIVGTVTLFFLSLQGGSIVTQLFTAPDRAYWQNSKLEPLNNDLKKTLKPLVIR